jgi:hypothetical protein
VQDSNNNPRETITSPTLPFCVLVYSKKCHDDDGCGSGVDCGGGGDGSG